MYEDVEEARPFIDQLCKNCEHMAETTAGRGECRRYPPAPDFHRVNFDDWCGEFHASDEKIYDFLRKERLDNMEE